MKTLCLVTPNFNYARYLKHTIRSVLDQECANLEYIIVDGGSTDGSQRIIEQYAPQLHYWHSKKDRGLYHAINIGFSHSRAPLMGWLNSDDIHLPWTLQAVVSIFAQNPDVQWLTTLKPMSCDSTGERVFTNGINGYSQAAFLDGRYVLPVNERPVEVAPTTRLQGCIPQESTFWRRELWDKAGGYVAETYGEAGDFELWSRFFEHAELYGLEMPLAVFRGHSQQKSKQTSGYLQDTLKALTKARSANGWRRNQLREAVFRLRKPSSQRILRGLCYRGKKIAPSNQNDDVSQPSFLIRDGYFA